MYCLKLVYWKLELKHLFNRSKNDLSEVQIKINNHEILYQQTPARFLPNNYTRTVVK